MAGEIYQVEGIILGYYNHGEDDKIISVITNKLGYIHAKSIGVRKISSKLRNSLANYNYVNLDLVRGKRGWKIIGAFQIARLTGEKNNKGLKVFSRIANLIKRISGEEKNELLFAEVKKLFYDIKEQKEIDKYSELFSVIKILYYLGYWDDKKILQENTHEEVKANYKSLLEEVNSSIEQAIS